MVLFIWRSCVAFGVAFVIKSATISKVGQKGVLIAEFYLVDRGLRHRLPGSSSLVRLVILP
jgi:hypothetical protein